MKAVLSFNPIFHENPNEIYIPVYQAQSLQFRPAISYQLSSSIPHSEEKRIIWIWTINNGHSKNKIGKLWSMSLKMVTYTLDLAKGVLKISLFIHIHEQSYWIIRTYNAPAKVFTDVWMKSLIELQHYRGVKCITHEWFLSTHCVWTSGCIRELKFFYHAASFN